MSSSLTHTVQQDRSRILHRSSRLGLRLSRVAMGAFTAISAACGGGDAPTPITPPPVVSVSVSGPLVAIPASSTTTFTATVTGSTNSAVTWSVETSGTTNVGAISSSGVYTAPPAAGTFTVRATAAADPTKSGTATVMVLAPPITLSISPSAASVQAGGSVQLSAVVVGSNNGAVTWDLPAGATSGTIVSTGAANATYTAPTTIGTYQVRATSVADPTKTALALITTTAGSGFRVTGPARVAPLASTQFTATFNDAIVAATWSIDGAANGCTVSSTGVFTAGPTVTSVTLRATDAAQRTATMVVSVATQVTLSLIVPANPSLTTADMLTFYWTVSPTGVSSVVNWSVGPSTAGTTIPVDYFRGFVPSASAGTVTLTATSVADPTVSASFTATVTSATGTPFSATSGTAVSSRYEHTAAAMPDGRVVLIGGQRTRAEYSPLSTTEVFAPTTGTFSNGPTLRVPRLQAEAIAIDANRVLVTGGVEEYDLAHTEAEIVDLASGTSVAAANLMAAPRLFHQMVSITSGPHTGKVAVLGGFNGPVPYGRPTWQATASVDLFDPATNRFTPFTASMRAPRGAFSATPLLDGRILIVGGYNPATFATLASAEIFDPVSGTFTFTGNLTNARSNHTATRLANGTVLIVGGSNEGNDRATAELYNPVTGQFEAISNAMAVPRKHHAAALLSDGRVALIGGESGENIVRGSVEVFDPNTRTFVSLGRLAMPRRRPTATVLSTGPNTGRVLVFGGGAEGTVTGVAEIVR